MSDPVSADVKDQAVSAASTRVLKAAGMATDPSVVTTSQDGRERTSATGYDETRTDGTLRRQDPLQQPSAILMRQVNSCASSVQQIQAERIEQNPTPTLDHTNDTEEAANGSFLGANEGVRHTGLIILN